MREPPLLDLADPPPDLPDLADPDPDDPLPFPLDLVDPLPDFPVVEDCVDDFTSFGPLPPLLDFFSLALPAFLSFSLPYLIR